MRMPGERLQESSGEDRHDLYALQMHVFADKATDTTSIIPTEDTCRWQDSALDPTSAATGGWLRGVEMGSAMKSPRPRALLRPRDFRQISSAATSAEALKLTRTEQSFDLPPTCRPKFFWHWLGRSGQLGTNDG